MPEPVESAAGSQGAGLTMEDITFLLDMDGEGLCMHHVQVEVNTRTNIQHSYQHEHMGGNQSHTLDISKQDQGDQGQSPGFRFLFIFRFLGHF